MSLHTPIDDSAVMYAMRARSAERAPGAVLDTAWRRVAERGLAVRVGERGAGASSIRDVAAAIALRDGRGGPLADLEGAIRTAALRTRVHGFGGGVRGHSENGSQKGRGECEETHVENWWCVELEGGLWELYTAAMLLPVI